MCNKILFSLSLLVTTAAFAMEQVPEQTVAEAVGALVQRQAERAAEGEAMAGCNSANEKFKLSRYSSGIVATIKGCSSREELNCWLAAIPAPIAQRITRLVLQSEGPEHIPVSDIIARMPMLESFMHSRTGKESAYFNFEDFSALTVACKNLREIELRCCGREEIGFRFGQFEDDNCLFSEELITVLQQAKNLEVLTLSFITCPDVSREMLGLILRSCKKLKSLNLHFLLPIDGEVTSLALASEFAHFHRYYPQVNIVISFVDKQKGIVRFSDTQDLAPVQENTRVVPVSEYSARRLNWLTTMMMDAWSTDEFAHFG